MKLNETKICPNCDFEGFIECYTVLETKETYCKCPNCKYTYRSK